MGPVTSCRVAASKRVDHAKARRMCSSRRFQTAVLAAAFTSVLSSCASRTFEPSSPASTDPAQLRGAAFESAIESTATSKPIHAAVDVPRGSHRELRGVVRVAGRSPDVPVRGSLTVSCGIGDVAIAPSGEFVIRDLPRRTVCIGSSIEGALDGSWIQAFDPRASDRVVELSVRSVHDVSVSVVHVDGRALGPHDPMSPRAEDLRVVWTEHALVPSERIDRTLPTVLPDAARVGPSSKPRPAWPRFDEDRGTRVDAITTVFTDQPTFATLVLGDVVLDSVRVQPEDANVVLRLDPNVLAVSTSSVDVVVANSRSPRSIEAAQIKIGSRALGWSLSRPTDQDGRVRFECVPHGVLEILAKTCPSCSETCKEIELTPTGERATFALDVEPLGTFRGHVLPMTRTLTTARVECRRRSDAVPVANEFSRPMSTCMGGAVVNRIIEWPPLRAGESWKRYEMVCSTPIAADGRFEFTDVPDGVYVLNVLAGNAIGPDQEVVMSAGFSEESLLSGP